MTAKEAVTLFKSEYFENRKAWKRLAKRYYTRNCNTVVEIISERYNVKDKKKIKEELLLEMKITLSK